MVQLDTNQHDENILISIFEKKESVASSLLYLKQKNKKNEVN